MFRYYLSKSYTLSLVQQDYINFVPSLADLLMAQWEEDVGYALKKPELVLWARYIDDILHLWKVNLDSLQKSMIEINNINNQGISLSYEASCNNNSLFGP